MREEGVDLSNFRSKQLTLEMVEKADLILIMQKSHKFHVFALDPKARHKTFTLKEFSGETEQPDIADPYGAEMNAYKACAEESICNSNTTGILYQVYSSSFYQINFFLRL